MKQIYQTHFSRFMFCFLLIGFRITGFAQLPTISSFSPTSGSVGSLVTIVGTNLNAIDTLRIGSVSAIKISAKTDTLVAMVMPGAITGNIYLANAGGNVTSGSNFTIVASIAPNTQQGNKLVGTGSVGSSLQGRSVSLSADGNTAIVGGHNDNGQGAAWVYTRSGNTWAQQGSKLVGTGNVGAAGQGTSLSLSADGNTAIVGGPGDNSGQGAAWVYTRSGNTWTQQGNKLVGTGSVGQSNQGFSVSLSADGNTAIVGGYHDNSGQGAAWVYTRSGNTWAQQGSKLVGTGNVGAANQGFSVSLSDDGNTAIIGGFGDNNNQGAAWVYTRIGNTWTQQGNKLVGTGSVVVGGGVAQGVSVSLSADGNTAIVGGHFDNNFQGAAWVYTRNGNTWTQQGNKLVGTGSVGQSLQGYSVSLSADGNTAMVGGWNDGGQGAAWVYNRTGNTWTQHGNKLVGTGGVGVGEQGWSISLSADGNTAIVGGDKDNNQLGAAWVYFGALSVDSNLSALTISSGTINPTFSSSVISYTASVSNATASVTVTPTNANSNASVQVRINGGTYASVASGSASSALALNVGSNTIDVKVTAQNGTSIKIYTITVTRLALPPTISSFSPTSGSIGSEVIITGSNFNSTPLQNIVFFGATKANVLSASSNSLTVSVPHGTTYQNITVTNLGTSLMAYSNKPFNTTFNGTINFISKQDIATGNSYPYNLRIKDLDGDGKSDISLLNGGTNTQTISVFKNTSTTGFISFASKIEFNAGLWPYSISVDDIDGDGKPDINFTNANSNSISVLRNTSSIGNISFASKVDFTTGASPYSVVVGDIDGDGKPELAIANWDSNSVSIFRNISNVGSIGFASKLDFATGAQPFSLVLGDIDGNGKPDLAVTNSNNNSMSIFLNNSTLGNINFGSKVDFSTGPQPYPISIGDLDGDGKPDIVVGNIGSDSISIFLNTSNSNNVNFAPKIDLVTGTDPYSINIGDIDGDGKPDIAIGNTNSNSISVYKNTSTLGSISFVTKNDFPTGTNPYSANIGDIDGDGKPDLAVSNFNSNTFSIIQQASNNANLLALTISSGALNPSFAPASISYSSSVSNSTSSITVTPTRSDANASIQVRINNGTYTALTSGSASSALSLNVGSNSIDVKVTAQDGTTIKTYTITVTRLATPTITSFTPTSGSIGTLVTIVGNNLSAIDTLRIGGVSAIKISAKIDTLVAMVMPGANTGKIFITTHGGSAISSSNFTITASGLPSAQQGSKLVGTGNAGTASQGFSVSVSANGNTAIVGGVFDSNYQGAVWIYNRSEGIWSQQGSKLVGTGSVGSAEQGRSVSISADGNTAIVGGRGDNNYQGAVWIYTRSGGVWSQQGNKLVGTGNIGAAAQGVSVCISGDGNTAIVGGEGDNLLQGAAWIYTRSGNTWTQQGNKLVGTGVVFRALQGRSVSLSADGNTAIVGGPADNNGEGAAWVYTRNGNTWTQQGSKLVATGNIGQSSQGTSVSLSADGNTAIVGGLEDNISQGAAWVYTRNGNTWTQQGSKLVGTGNIGSAGIGVSVSLSADGNTALVGGHGDNGSQGAAWVYRRSGNTWNQQGTKLVGTGNIGAAQQGLSASLSADGNTAIIGGPGDNSEHGAAWVYFGALSADSNLSALTISLGTINPSFSSSIVSYTTSVSNGTTSITLTPTVANNNASAQLRINGGVYTSVNSGSSSAALALNIGSNSIEIKVTAQNGTSIKIYTITVTRAGSSNADLSALTLSSGTLSPAFASATTSYTASVSNAITSLTVTPTLADTTASVQVRVNGGTYASVSNGSASSALALNVGSNTINVLVTAQDSSSKTYTITVTRTGSSGSTLNITAFFEGLYLGSSNMTAAPFNADGLTPNTIADTLTIVLHDKYNFDSVFAVTSTVNTSGLAIFNLPAIYTGNAYYIAIKNRNSLETWTADTVLITSTTSYNFSNNALKAYGSNLVNLGSGVFGIYSGDINQDGLIDRNDFTDVDNDNSNFASGYLYTDTNGDGFVDGNDFTLIDNNGSMFISISRP